MKKRMLALILSLVFALSAIGLAGCGSGSSDAADSAADSDTEVVDIEVILDWYPNATHAFLFMAEANGYFEEAGLNVTFTSPANTTDPLTMVAANKADIGIYYTKDIITAIAEEDVPVTVIGNIYQSPTDGITFLTEKGFEDPSDFAGMTIGYSGVESTAVDFANVCSAYGLTEDDYELINVGFDLVTALTSGSVDVVLGCYSTAEVLEMELAGYDVTFWTYTEFGVPTYSSGVFIASNSLMETKSEAYTKFLEACQKGYEDVVADQDAALEILLEKQDEENYALDEELTALELAAVLEIQACDEGFLYFEDEMYEENTSYLYENGLISEELDVSTFISHLLD